MPVYRVYYATDFTNREFVEDIYVAVEANNRIDALRQAFDRRPQAVKWGMVAESIHYDLMMSAHRLEQIKARLDEPAPKQAEKYVLYSDSSKTVLYDQPKLGTAKVNWWQRGNQKYGNRIDKHSGKAYDVYAIDDNWITIHMGLGFLQTVRRAICQFTPKVSESAAA